MRFQEFKKLTGETRDSHMPRDAWKQELRSELLATVRRSDLWKKNSYIERSFMAQLGDIFKMSGVAFKPVAITTLIVAVVFSGSFATVSAAKDSIPGDRLYPVKLSVEKAQVGLALSEEKKANLEMSFASTRLDEVTEILDRKGVDSAEQIGQAIKNFNKSLADVEDLLEQAEEQQPALSEIVNEKTLILEQNLREIKEKITVEAASATAASQEPVLSETKESTLMATDASLDESSKATLSEEQVNTKEGSSTEETILDTATTIEQNEAVEATLKQDAKDKKEATKDAADKATSLKKSINHIDQALERVDETNTKSLVAIVKEAVKSPDNKKKEDALDKLQKKIESIETKIQHIEDVAVVITQEIDKKPSAASSTASTLPASKNSSSTIKADLDTLMQTLTETSVLPTLLPTIQKSIATSTQAVIKQQIEEEVKTKPVVAKKTIEEAKKIVESKETGKLAEALQKVTETSQIVKDATKAIKKVEAIIEDEAAANAASEEEKSESTDQNALPAEQSEDGKVLGEQTTTLSEPAKERTQTQKSTENQPTSIEHTFETEQTTNISVKETELHVSDSIGIIEQIKDDSKLE